MSDVAIVRPMRAATEPIRASRMAQTAAYPFIGLIAPDMTGPYSDR